ncbi:MAG: helix-turn-helix transcriptional regulator [Sphingomonadaceae bacterium]|nr:helix-turn-helix transcriptional regulator [Sphingomonadaceae bacterium]
MEGPGQSLDTLFGALADPTRRLILDELRKRDGQSLFELCGRIVSFYDISLSRQAISKHLAVLEDTGLIACTRQGRTKQHSLIRPEALQYAERWIAAHRSELTNGSGKGETI